MPLRCMHFRRLVHTLKHSRGLHSERSPRVVFSGIQPTGIPHLGNYLGALSNWVQLQNTADIHDTLIYSVVGLHAITVPQDSQQLRSDKLDAFATLLAIGLDPSRCIIYYQEDVQEHAELAWILGCNTSLGRLGRMTSYKSKVASLESASNDEKLGLFAYPVLQAADILLYKSTHVPVGEDQRQHLELTRDLAQSFNQRSTPSIFTLPQTILTPAKRILSLRDPTQKMSKSAKDPRSRILLSDSRDEIAQKIRKAITDSDFSITYDPTARPGVSNLLRILRECKRLANPSQLVTPSPLSAPEQPINSSPNTTTSRDRLQSEEGEVDSEEAELHGLAESFRVSNTQTPQFKEHVVEAIDSCIAPMREKYQRYKADEAFLRSVAKNGAERAREIAGATMAQVRARIGLGDL